MLEPSLGTDEAGGVLLVLARRATAIVAAVRSLSRLRVEKIKVVAMIMLSVRCKHYGGEFIIIFRPREMATSGGASSFQLKPLPTVQVKPGANL